MGLYIHSMIINGDSRESIFTYLCVRSYFDVSNMYIHIYIYIYSKMVVEACWTVEATCWFALLLQVWDTLHKKRIGAFWKLGDPKNRHDLPTDKLPVVLWKITTFNGKILWKKMSCSIAVSLPEAMLRFGNPPLWEGRSIEYVAWSTASTTSGFEP